MLPAIFFLLVLQLISAEFLPCQKLLFNESFVCVCNSTYCDNVPVLEDVEPENLYLFTSDRESLRFDLKVLPITRNFTADNSSILLSPHPLSLQQTIEGFGAAFTDAAAINILSLPPAAQDKLMEAYFAKDGLKYNMGRVPLASTDFSTRAYSYDEWPGDTRMIHFALTEEDTIGKIPLIKKAEKIRGGKLKLFTGTWGAPSWMTTNHEIMNGGRIRPMFYSAFAGYHIKFLEAYAKYGIEFWAMSNGNEPINSLVSNSWSAEEMAEWLGSHLGPQLNSKFPNVRILLLDDFPDTIPDFIPVLENKKANRYIYGIAIHPYPSVEKLVTNLEKAHACYPDKFLLQTEYCVGVQEAKRVILGSWKRAEDYAIRIIEGMNHFATTWTDWNLALDMEGGPNFLKNFVDAAIIVNGTEFYKQPIFFIQGHFSHFIPPGSRRIELKIQNGANILATGVATPEGNVVAVILNRLDNEIDVQILTEVNSGVNIKLPAKSISTAVYSKKDAKQ